jgi:hypothetical protein
VSDNLGSRHAHSRREQFASVEKRDAVLRLLKGESIDQVCDDLGVSIRRLERWKDEFIGGGLDALSRRKDLDQGWWARNRTGIIQWIFVLIALVALVVLLNRFMQRSSD